MKMRYQVKSSIHPREIGKVLISCWIFVFLNLFKINLQCLEMILDDLWRFLKGFRIVRSCYKSLPSGNQVDG